MSGMFFFYNKRAPALYDSENLASASVTVLSGAFDRCALVDDYTFGLNTFLLIYSVILFYGLMHNCIACRETGFNQILRDEVFKTGCADAKKWKNTFRLHCLFGST